MQDRPTLTELTLAVREFLETEIAPALSDPRLKFRTLVAMNALGMIAREAELEESRLREECSGLLKVLGEASKVPTEVSSVKAMLLEGNAALSRQIRSGTILDGTFDHLQRAARAKLEVSNPAYLKKYPDAP